MADTYEPPSGPVEDCIVTYVPEVLIRQSRRAV